MLNSNHRHSLVQENEPENKQLTKDEDSPPEPPETTGNILFEDIIKTNRSPLPGASISHVPLSQPCPVSFYF